VVIDVSFSAKVTKRAAIPPTRYQRKFYSEVEAALNWESTVAGEALDFLPASISSILQFAKTNSALLAAPNARAILHAVHGCIADIEQASLRLLYQSDKAVEVVASWQDGVIWSEDPAVGRTFWLEDYPIFDLENVKVAPLLAVEDIAIAPVKLPFAAHGLVLIKIYGPAFDHWQGILCVTWSIPHRCTTDEDYLYRGISQAASAAITNYRLRQETMAHVERLQEVDKLKNKFLYTISHELRSPLGSNLSLLEVVLSGDDGEINEAVRSDLDLAYNDGKHLMEVIGEILDLAKMEAGKDIQLEVASINMVELIGDAVRILQATADAKGLALEIVLPSFLPMMVVDSKRIKQVVINLLSNAIKFTDHGTIRIQAEVEGNAVVIAVSDPGIGLSPEDKKIIFAPFSQGDHRQGGTGLGLPISKQLVELHGGKIWVESEVGKGSTFYVLLPILLEPSPV